MHIFILAIIIFNILYVVLQFDSKHFNNSEKNNEIFNIELYLILI